MSTFAKTSAIAVLAMITLAKPTSADDGSAAIETARRAIAIGHGADCSLDMKPVERNGYYPCIDIAPYRFVFSYGSVKAFVIQKDRAPYPIMDAPIDAPEFLRDGPWKSDMSARVALWWSDTVEGGSKRLSELQGQTESQKAAEDYVSKMMGKQEAPPLVAAPQPPASSPDTTELDEDIKKILAH
ncbi:hypothetical protein G6L37_01455 [Agrobacterium rubi]|nr:hypothetical protein [Agrobacterium rubi]NTF24059.1 hypothetical protein [Agrobacterium rubi]